ncbi:hypothetical protein [Aquabacterium sp. J223]|uniref:hypothetical protein n=1 Tax=Aquabacterium sp. J223 TaxID=2898431 RepID=UPI0021ADFFFA|nr:hypothetical protein [Aquabacterium sp. J223]UUX97232.1 hypothetical protein LRS07_08330 [Aquabacterium sp. J223]
MDQRVGSSSRDILQRPVPGGHSPTTEQRRTLDLAGEIDGWGSDLDPARRPGVPRDKAPEIGVESLYPPLPQQPARIKIHKSTEHGKLTPVFGTSCPPRGLSGALRDRAYRYSEGRLPHWLTLLLADRVNVVEDLAGDLMCLRLPNLPKELGLTARWRHDRAGVVRKAAIAGLCVVAVMALRRSRRR